MTIGDSMQKRFFKQPFPPPSSAKRIIARRHCSVNRKEAVWDWIIALSFFRKYELGYEVCRGHFCALKLKKSDNKSLLMLFTKQRLVLFDKKVLFDLMSSGFVTVMRSVRLFVIIV